MKTKLIFKKYLNILSRIKIHLKSKIMV